MRGLSLLLGILSTFAARRSSGFLWKSCLVLLLLSDGISTFASDLPKLSDLRLQEASGQPANLSISPETKAIVFLFVSVECPISNSYAPEFKRLASEFEAKHVLFKLVYPNTDETPEAVNKHRKEFELPLPALRDPWHDLVKVSQVQATPESAIFVPKIGFVYHGRIDNRYAALGVARPEATEHDLRDALQAILDGKPVPHKSTKVVGCSIPPLR